MLKVWAPKTDPNPPKRGPKVSAQFPLNIQVTVCLRSHVNWLSIRTCLDYLPRGKKVLKAFSFHVRWSIANMEKKWRRGEKLRVRIINADESANFEIKNALLAHLFWPNKSRVVFLLDRINRDETGKPSAANFPDEKKVFTLGLSPKGLLETGSQKSAGKGSKFKCHEDKTAREMPGFLPWSMQA